eukprot:scaffold52433_cov63-Phaeocystis_antarctica.AAC.1
MTPPPAIYHPRSTPYSSCSSVHRRSRRSEHWRRHSSGAGATHASKFNSSISNASISNAKRGSVVSAVPYKFTFGLYAIGMQRSA